MTSIPVVDEKDYKLKFERLSEKVFALNPGVRWVAVGRPGQPPLWTYRPDIKELNSSASDEAEERLMNPAILTLAEARGNWNLNGLQFVVLAYGTLTQVITRLRGEGHISISLNLEVDAWQVAKKLADLIQEDNVM